jgi:hypothetical protein
MKWCHVAVNCGLQDSHLNIGAPWALSDTDDVQGIKYAVKSAIAIEFPGFMEIKVNNYYV